MASSWDMTKPLDHSLNATWPDEVRNLKDLLASRLILSDTIPAVRTDGAAFADGDVGSIWIHGDDTIANTMYVMTSQTTGTPTWTKMSVSLTLEIIAAAHTWAAEQTFDEGVTMKATKVLTTEIVKAVGAAGIVIKDKDDVAMITLLDGGTIDVSASSIVEETLDGTADLLASSDAIKTYVDAQVATKDMSPAEEVDDTGSVGVTVFSNGLRIARGTMSIIDSESTTHSPSGFTKIYSVTAIFIENSDTDRFQPKLSALTDTSFTLRNTNTITLTAYYIVIGR